MPIRSTELVPITLHLSCDKYNQKFLEFLNLKLETDCDYSIDFKTQDSLPNAQAPKNRAKALRQLQLFETKRFSFTNHRRIFAKRQRP